MNISASDKSALRKWHNEAKAIRRATTVNIDEKPAEKEKRIAKLLDDPIKFCEYYFPHYCSSDFGDFQIKAINKIAENPIIYAVLEWARGHAKSSTIAPMLVLYLTLTEKDVNLLMVSYNADNAIDLLKPVKLEFENNQRILNDFGTQKGLNDWDSKKFVTVNNCSFRAIGSGQSPRGTKEQEVRPNMIILDDIDEDEMLRNPQRLDQTFDWVSEALYNTFDITGKKRFIVTNNRIAKDSILVRASKKADYHLIVNAIRKATTKLDKEVTKTQLQYCKGLLSKETDSERSKVLKEAIKYLNDNYIPTWHQRYNMQQIMYIKDKIGSRAFDKEYCNNPITEGKTFKADWIVFKKLPPLSNYKTFTVAYLDPGFKKTKTSDSKSWILMGLMNAEYHVIKAYCDKASVQEMIEWGYDINSYVVSRSASTTMKMEEVFLQDLLYKDFSDMAKIKKLPLPVSGDKRKKPDKDARIESLSGLFERGSWYFNEDEKENHHMKKLVDQFLAFQSGVSTLKDGCDACEGAVFILNEKLHLNSEMTFGKPYNNKNRV